ncbi:MAG TPA: hypothetical protein VMR81_00570 [Patescibacteria group bacterium]|nr:hypothetical protein [Patescibacteria group bacterium]
MGEKNNIIIDRLTGKPFGYRDDSDAGIAGELMGWSIKDIEQKALRMGKQFKPNPEIINRLQTDLDSGAIVLFDEVDVAKAFQYGIVALEEVPDLFNLVGIKGLNDVGIIPPQIVSERIDPARKGALVSWLLTNQSC